MIKYTQINSLNLLSLNNFLIEILKADVMLTGSS
jgi:hypothetical protein